jgi:hypothetical protein
MSDDRLAIGLVGVGLLLLAVIGTLGALWWWALAGMEPEAGLACIATIGTTFAFGLAFTHFAADGDDA